MLKFAEKVDGSMKISSVTTNQSFMLKNMQKRQAYKKPALWRVRGVECKGW